MQSSGGLISPDLARDFPVRIIESGPAAGILMCAIVGKAEGREHVITFDMGGTTAKLGAVDGGKPAIMPTFEVDLVRYKKGSGLPINVPAVEMIEIGAGGGSIARNDKGMIVVGPDSAGADPGPICYGRGGDGADHHRRQRRARLHLARLVQCGRHAARRGGCRRRHQAGDRRPARHIGGGGRLGHPPGRDLQHGERAAHRLGGARARSPPLRHGGVRRRRAAACGAHGSRASAFPGDRALRRRRRLGHRPARGGAAHRRDDDADHAASMPRTSAARSPRSIATLEAQALRRRRSESRQAASRNGRATRRCAMPARGSRSTSILPPGPIDASYAGKAIEAFKEAYLRKNKFLDPRGHDRSGGLDAGRDPAIARRPAVIGRAAGRRARRARGRRARHGSRRPAATPTPGSSTATHLRMAPPSPVQPSSRTPTARRSSCRAIRRA